MAFYPPLGCSTISFRHQDLLTALTTIRSLGFEEIDLGALPGVCNHVPFVLDDRAVAEVIGSILDSGLFVRSVNADIGDLNAVLTPSAQLEREEHLNKLLDLASGVGAKALVLPCGALCHDPVVGLDEDLDRIVAELKSAASRASERGIQLWVESLHFLRLSWNLDVCTKLHERLVGSDVGIVMDFSHLVASETDPVGFINRFAQMIQHVHLRDAVPGNINLSLGNGAVDFALGIQALQAIRYQGHYSLELETRDISDDERPEVTMAAARFITSLIGIPSLSGEQI
ncbi:sugar phosphate isomerase/epimerase [Arthrobacter sp. zg-ZUI100]|nr:sugar phosphate isomerase/epimerase [Arthrobacter jiangjiafuii]MBP3037552.1 sugar phosphate isomerase/epimerase [Arthrobacter jiangjiafuii]